MTTITPKTGEAVVAIEDVSRRFGKTVALDGVSVSVPCGCVYGLVGENGAGKTTLINHVLGLMTPSSGTVRVFGKDPTKDPVYVLGRVGYLSEDRDLPEWMRVGELLRYTQAFYPNWDPAYAEELLETFGLDPAQKVRELSRGKRAQAGLLVALAHRPELLVLDEPSSGLDAVVRRDILGAIIRTVADEGRTVLFSSHLLEEVERVADHVTMIHEGVIVIDGALDAVKERHHLVTIRFAENQVHPPKLEGAIFLDGLGRDWAAVCNGEFEGLRQSVQDYGGEIVDNRPASLEEIFVARVGRPQQARPE
jgi:ABC-2 type transport system ATP-binding protein